MQSNGNSPRFRIDNDNDGHLGYQRTSALRNETAPWGLMTDIIMKSGTNQDRRDKCSPDSRTCDPSTTPAVTDIYICHALHGGCPHRCLVTAHRPESVVRPWSLSWESQKDPDGDANLVSSATSSVVRQPFSQDEAHRDIHRLTRSVVVHSHSRDDNRLVLP